ncbi:Hypothetical protein SFBmNL_00853 [Candidatus Arthromitus sp. SFB-mouse-NL]|uniref:hypothetical protein n=1 Tax=Candidatus Arthromitus sp. SFB-mouse-NL TaxID=1508644 RepID=UPI00049A1B14|nr:hypothetical protein [Candidatus Arthromitus sp. SFB-mouse-NL]AID44761.1 Hypothetical protein SFBmNL_00853 [Candidatus Arthromitus sp. SFB-mouse-NL]
MNRNKRSIIYKSVAALSLSIIFLGLGKQTSQALKLSSIKVTNWLPTFKFNTSSYGGSSLGKSKSQIPTNDNVGVNLKGISGSNGDFLSKTAPSGLVFRLKCL